MQNKRKNRSSKKPLAAAAEAAGITETPVLSGANGSATGSASTPSSNAGSVTKRHMAPQIEEVEDDE